jgi:mannosyltransferase OCH1-like enzyme
MLILTNKRAIIQKFNEKIVENNKLKLYKQPYIVFKKIYNPIIPLKIFQTWFTKDLHPKMKEAVENIKTQNPQFEHFLFDDNDCREFIKTHFELDVLKAYDSLIPGAYKADLWRYCIIYIYGGIYLDVKFRCINGFKLIELTENNHFVKDRQPPLSIYNALLACQKNHPFLLMAINKIVENVKNKIYGLNPLYPTGPQMLGSIILQKKIKINIDMYHYNDGGYIIYKNRFIISTEYPEYNSERTKTYEALKTKRYNLLWNEKNIYK